ncbi:MAG TPA: hypothetical protein VLV15_02565, partial [Dongiaceae bacterium]|nr:hypothetical protein [Dongiaceae bacterium]
YLIADVVVDGVSRGALASYSFSNVSANHTIAATFAASLHTLQASAGPNGTIAPSGAVSVAHGGSQAFTITPNSCFQIADVVVDGVSRGVLASYTFSNVTSDHTITASFAAASYSIAASAGANGSISPSGAVSVACGGSQTFAITPNTCAQIADVVVDGVSRGAVASYTFSSVAANHTITASFSLPSFSIAASAGPNGTISPSGTVAVACGGSQTFTLTPAPCYQVADVVVDGVSRGALTSYTFANVSASHTITASFVIGTFTITASSGPNGTVVPLGTLNPPCGTDQTFSIIPDPCYQISDVVVDGVSRGVLGSYTFVNVQASHTISATFGPGNYTINSSAGANGSISPSGVVPVACSASQSFTISPGACAHIASVVVDGVSRGALASYTFSNVHASHTIVANFALDTYTIVASADPNGTIAPSGSVPVNCGASQTFTITPDACYQIADVVVDGLSRGALASYTFTSVTATHTIAASFALATYTITASAGPNGTIVPSGTLNPPCGSTQVFTITPDPCFQVADVVVDGASRGALTSYAFVNVGANHTIAASFTAASFAIAASAGANGSISPSGVVPVACGGSQTFTITADVCAQIADVVVDGLSRGAVGSYSFTSVAASHTITASFTLLSYAVAASAGPNGSVSPSGVESVACGASRTFTITPDPCYQIADVVVDGVSRGAVGSYSFAGVSANHTLTATFTLTSYTIAASAGPNGAIAPSGAVPVGCGASPTFAITPDPCYQIADVVVDGLSRGAVASYTFTNVTANHTIAASFALASYSITASAGAGGSISPNGATPVACGASQTFTITPSGCAQIADVVVDGASRGALASYTFTNVTANHTITASFSLVSYTIAASAGSNGTIGPSGAISVPCGGSQTFTITPNACYQIGDVVV